MVVVTNHPNRVMHIRNPSQPSLSLSVPDPIIRHTISNMNDAGDDPPSQLAFLYKRHDATIMTLIITVNVVMNPNDLRNISRFALSSAASVVSGILCFGYFRSKLKIYTFTIINYINYIK
jgi:hypothetical protein